MIDTIDGIKKMSGMNRMSGMNKMSGMKRMSSANSRHHEPAVTEKVPTYQIGP